METRNNSRFAAVVLAAGMSSRMGEAKQLLQLGDNTLLGQVLDNVRSSRVKDIVLVLGHEAEKIKERISTDNLRLSFVYEVVHRVVVEVTEILRGVFEVGDVVNYRSERLGLSRTETLREIVLGILLNTIVLHVEGWIDLLS